MSAAMVSDAAMEQRTPWGEELTAAFPGADPGMEPFGSRILVQLRTPKMKTKGGILLVGDTQDTLKWTTQTALVRAVGPLAFRNRTTMEPWREGAWCRPGDFVRVPLYGGDRWQVDIDGTAKALFVVFDDLHIIGRITGDPLKMAEFV
jgi:co-chaperonin GroES (HSP10)